MGCPKKKTKTCTRMPATANIANTKTYRQTRLLLDYCAMNIEFLHVLKTILNFIFVITYLLAAACSSRSSSTWRAASSSIIFTSVLSKRSVSRTPIASICNHRPPRRLRQRVCVCIYILCVYIYIVCVCVCVCVCTHRPTRRLRERVHVCVFMSTRGLRERVCVCVYSCPRGD